MKKTKLILLGAISLLFLVPIVQGDPLWWPGALNSGYAITTDYHGKIVLVGTPVTAYAGTTKPPYPEAQYVVIRWLRPLSDGTQEEAWKTGLLPLVDSGTYWDGKKIYWAIDTRTPDVIGDWGVQAIFYNSDEVEIGPPNNDKVAIKATSFFSVPEVPLGTITAMLSMLTALAVFALKRTRI